MRLHACACASAPHIRSTLMHARARRHHIAPPPMLQADILVSELLGSFGDNELSPECLDGAQALLKPDGISIPCSYTSFLAPVTTCKLHDAIKAYKDVEHWETPYVVKLHRHVPAAGLLVRWRAALGAARAFWRVALRACGAL